MAAQNQNNPNVEKVQNILAHGKINEVIDYYKKQLGDRDNFVDAYLHQILHLGLSIKNDDQLFNTFLENYSIFFQPLVPLNLFLNLLIPIFITVRFLKRQRLGSKRIITDSRLYLHSGLAPFQAEFLENTKTIPTNTIVTGTFSIHFDDFLKLNKPQSYKAFFVMRDPRDLVISAYFSNRYSHLLMDHIGETRKILNDLSLEEGIIYTI